MMNVHTLALIWAQVAAALPAIGAGFGVFLAFWVAAVVTRAMMGRVAREVASRGGHGEVLRLGAVVAYWAAIAFGVVIGLGTMGVNVSALVASLGLTGFALGFALRDVVANLLSGVLILTFRPFHYGDRIAVTGFEGIVVDIDLRYTTLHADGKRHLIPNQTMYSNPVTVISAEPAPPSDSAARE